MNTSTQRILLGLLIFASVTGILIAVLQVMISERDPAIDATYEYDLSKLKSTADVPQLFTEVEQFIPAGSNPTSIAIGPDDHLYVAGAGTVQVYDRQGTRVREWAIAGAPQCMTVAPDGTVYLGLRRQVEVYDPDGSLRQTWPPLDGEANITAVAILETNVFIADYGNRHVVRCDLKGTVTGIIGTKDPERDIPGFIIPSPYFDCIAADDGTLWVVNPGRHLLQNFMPDGRLRWSWGKASMAIDGFCGCCNPTHIDLLADGSFVTSEKGLVRVKLYKADGEFAGLVAGPDRFDDGTTGLDLAVDSSDRIYVLDPHRGQVRIFEKK